MLNASRRFSALSSTAIAIAVVTLAAAPSAALTLYMHGWSSNTNLYALDTGTGVETLIGSSGVDDVGGLSFSGPGTLYGVTRGGSLYTFDTGTAAATLIGSTGISAPEGLSFATNGSTLYGSGGGSLYSIDPNTAAATNLGPIALGDVDGLTLSPFAVDTIAGSFAAGTLFATDTNNLFAIDPGTLLVTSLGSANANEALAFGADGILYGHNFSGSLYRIDLLTMSSTLVANTSGPITGLASIIPEPTTGALLAFGLVALGISRQRA